MENKNKSVAAPVKVTEKVIMKQIKLGLEAHGWFVFRVPPSLYSDKGLCDLVAVKNGVSVFIEVKNPKGKQSDAQKIFESRIMGAGASYILARGIDDVEHLFCYTEGICRA